MIKKILFLSILLLGINTIHAQTFLRAFDMVSRAKTSYITLESGEEVKGKIKKIRRRKGLIKEIAIEPKNGKKRNIPIKDIKLAYLPQSGLDKYIKIDDFLNNAREWGKGIYDKNRIKKGYAIFEKAKVKLKGKERTFLMQLINPHGCSRIKVYYDPVNTETMPLSVQGVTVAGKRLKSYYISKDGAVATRLKKKRYKKNFDKMFGDCSSIEKDTKWRNFEPIMFQYNYECK